MSSVVQMHQRNRSGAWRWRREYHRAVARPGQDSFPRAVALVIADYHMPGMNGVQLTRAIKGVAPATRVAIMTAEDMRDVARQAHTVAADYVLPKPYELAHLQQIIGESLPPAASDP